MLRLTLQIIFVLTLLDGLFLMIFPDYVLALFDFAGKRTTCCLVGAVYGLISILCFTSAYASQARSFLAVIGLMFVAQSCFMIAIGSGQDAPRSSEEMNYPQWLFRIDGLWLIAAAVIGFSTLLD